MLFEGMIALLVRHDILGTSRCPWRRGAGCGVADGVSACSLQDIYEVIAQILVHQKLSFLSTTLFRWSD